MPQVNAATPSTDKTDHHSTPPAIEVQLLDPYPSTSPGPEGTRAIHIPQVCTCCLKPTTSRAEVRWGTSSKSTVGVNRVKTIHWARTEFCVCDECQAHEKEYRRKRARLIRLVILLTTLLANALIFHFGYPFLSEPVEKELLGLFQFLLFFILLPTAIAIIFILLLDLIIRLSPLDPQHASRTKGVIMTSRSSFVFNNPGYGLAFALANKATYKTLTSTHTSKIRSRSLLESGALSTTLFVSIPLSIVATFALSLLIFMLTPASELTPKAWCPVSGILLVFYFILFAGRGEAGD